MYELFAVTAPGLEAITQQELEALGILPAARPADYASPTETVTAKGAVVPALTLVPTEKKIRKQARSLPGEPPSPFWDYSLRGDTLRAIAPVGGDESGGIAFEAGLDGLYRANLHLRTASRILLRLGEFYAAAFDELRKKAACLPWEEYLAVGKPVALRVTCHKSRLYHSDGVAERIAAAIGDRLGGAVKAVKFEEDAPHLALVVARLVHDRMTISLDTSGGLLHRRGYRLETAKAPLRETLAAGMLLASGWDADSPLIDPFCGSGTIPIEAVLMARRIVPGKNRPFAFMDWPNFDAALWQGTLEAAAAGERPCPAEIIASDRDAGAIRIAQSNAGRAGVLDDIQFSCRAVSAIEPPARKGWIVTNPPYGVRVSPTHDLRNLYSQLGNVLYAHCRGWQAGVLCSSDYLMGHTHLHLDRSQAFINGGIAVRLFTGKIT
jgi:putative N6-adenine-specific DNA methylase